MAPLYKVLIPFARRRGMNRTNHEEGSFIRMAPREAKSMVAAGVLELVVNESRPPEPERAEMPEPERAEKPRPVRRKRELRIT